MTKKEALSLKVGDTVYIVLMSHALTMRNPFLRTDKYRHSDYHKPLGFFKTTVQEIKDIFSNYLYFSLTLFLDTTPFKHLLLPGNIPQGKHIYDYAPGSGGSFRISDDNHFSKNSGPEKYLFFTEQEAKEFYQKELKKFTRNVRSYVSHLKDEIDGVQRLILEANEEINKYKFI